MCKLVTIKTGEGRGGTVNGQDEVKKKNEEFI